MESTSNTLIEQESKFESNSKEILIFAYFNKQIRVNFSYIHKFSRENLSYAI